VNAVESFSGGELVVGTAPPTDVVVELCAMKARQSPMTALKFPGPVVGRFKGFALFGLAFGAPFSSVVVDVTFDPAVSRPEACEDALDVCEGRLPVAAAAAAPAPRTAAAVTAAARTVASLETIRFLRCDPGVKDAWTGPETAAAAMDTTPFSPASSALVAGDCAARTILAT
jgi:hypothetical protein